MNKILYSAVIYQSDNFDMFIKDYLVSVFNQTDQNFDLLLVLDDLIVEAIKEYIVRYNKNKKNIFIHNFKDHTPIELRKKQIDLAYSFGYDILILSDFDENVAYNRVEEVSKYISEYAFAFNDFYIVDQNLNRLAEKSFFTTRKIPKVVSYKDILKFNFIGLGSLALNLKFFDYKKIKFPKEIIALDWYLVTMVLMSGSGGIALYNTYANYRQHNNSLVGFDFKLDKKKLNQGIAAKLAHYGILMKYNNIFSDLYDDMIELKEYIKNCGADAYINFINTNFDTNKFCWWENIKTKRDLKYDIKKAR